MAQRGFKSELLLSRNSAFVIDYITWTIFKGRGRCWGFFRVVIAKWVFFLILLITNTT